MVYRRGRRPRRPAYLHTNRTNIYHVSLRLQRVVEDCTVQYDSIQGVQYDCIQFCDKIKA